MDARRIRRCRAAQSRALERSRGGRLRALRRSRAHRRQAISRSDAGETSPTGRRSRTCFVPGQVLFGKRRAYQRKVGGRRLRWRLLGRHLRDRSRRSSDCFPSCCRSSVKPTAFFRARRRHFGGLALASNELGQPREVRVRLCRRWMSSIGSQPHATRRCMLLTSCEALRPKPSKHAALYSVRCIGSAHEERTGEILPLDCCRGPGVSKNLWTDTKCSSARESQSGS